MAAFGINTFVEFYIFKKVDTGGVHNPTLSILQSLFEKYDWENFDEPLRSISSTAARGGAKHFGYSVSSPKLMSLLNSLLMCSVMEVMFTLNGHALGQDLVCI